MSRSKNPNKYPSGYYDIVREITEGGGIFILPFPEKKQAERMRFDFYNFQGALEHAGDSLAIQAIRIKLTIRAGERSEVGETWELVFADRMLEKENIRIMEELAKQRGIRDEREGGEKADEEADKEADTADCEKNIKAKDTAQRPEEDTDAGVPDLYKTRE